MAPETKLGDSKRERRKTSAILDTESDDEDLFNVLSPSTDSAYSRQTTAKSVASSVLGGSMMSRANTAQQRLRRPGSSVELPGAKITAYAMGICTRMRLMDGINWEQIKLSLDPRSNRS